MEITYEVYRFYDRDNVYGDFWRKVTTRDNNVIALFRTNDKLEIGACLWGLKIVEISESAS